MYFHIVCEPLSEDVHLDGIELKQFIWRDPKEALKQRLNFSDGVEKSIENLVNGVRFNIESSNFNK